MGIAKPKPTKAKKAKKVSAASERRKLEKRLEALCREIVFWRDGSTCVEAEIDGARCGGSIQWGHFIPRSRSSWLKYAISNTFCQCANHNLLHFHGDPIFSLWFVYHFSAVKLAKLTGEMLNKKGFKWRAADYETQIEKYEKLVTDRHLSVFTQSDLIDFGYYG